MSGPAKPQAPAGSETSKPPEASGDDPETDGTDAAHPAWWRGQADGARGVVDALTEVLDRGAKVGTFANPKLDALACRIAELKVRAEPSAESLAEMPELTPEQLARMRTTRQRIDELQRALLDAATEIEDWAKYAGDYLVDKHGVADTVRAFRAIARNVPIDEVQEAKSCSKT